MEKITLFYLRDCPYCAMARKAIGELNGENPAYGKIEIEWIDESKNAVMADAYGYYYVPTLYLGGEKLYEAEPSQGYEEIKAHIRQALDTVLSRNRTCS